MEKLKALFGDKALTYAELEAALKDNKEVKLANLAAGGYVSKEKFEAREAELKAARDTISGLQEAAKKWDGVDVDKLKGDMAALQTKYDTDLAAAKLSAAVDMALIGAKARNPQLVKSALRMDAIKLDGDTVIGLTDQLARLKESDGYLFEPEAEKQNDNGGVRFGSGGAHGTSGVDYAKMSDEEYYASVVYKKE